MANRFWYSDRPTIIAECYANEQRLLDIGSGPAIILARLLDLNPTATGTAVDIASSLNLIQHPRIKSLPFDLRDLFASEKLPLLDASFDLILITEVLEHMLYPEVVLAEAYRVLAPEGRLLITVPNVASLEKRLSILFGSGRSMLGICGIVYERANDHIRWYTFRAMEQLLHQTGFEIVQRRSADFPFKINRIGFGRILCYLFPGLAEKIIVTARKIPVSGYSVSLYACPLHNRPMPIHLDQRCADPQPREKICQRCRFVWGK